MKRISVNQLKSQSSLSSEAFLIFLGQGETVVKFLSLNPLLVARHF